MDQSKEQLLREIAESFRDQIQKSSQRNRHERVSWDIAEQFNHLLTASEKVLSEDLKELAPRPLTQADQNHGYLAEQKYVDLAISADILVKLLIRMEPQNRVFTEAERNEGERIARLLISESLGQSQQQNPATDKETNG